jgi:hypothetical protein
MRGAMVLLALATMSLLAQVQAQLPKIGDPVPELRFKDIRALSRTLSDLGKKRAYVFVFTTTSCPLVRRSIPKLIDLDTR